jgi:hypothetical protein
MVSANISRRGKAAITAPVAVLVAALGLGCNSPSSPSPPVSPAATPLPPSPSPPGTSIRYNVSGIVTDDGGSPIANAQLRLYYEGSFKNVETSTDAHGYYSIVFESAAREYTGNADVVGTIFYTGGGEYENYYVQAVPWGTADVVKNLHLRRVRTLDAGQSIVISIDADSSLAYDGDDWMRMDALWEKFHIRVADAGVLIVAARPASGSIVPSIAVYCAYVADNCENDWVAVVAPLGSVARRVKANSLFEIRLPIPSGMAPQRYEVSTSLR